MPSNNHKIHALITGASSGLGKSLALNLCSQSEKMTFIGRDTNSLKQLEVQLKLINSELVVDIFQVDLIDQNQIAYFISHFLKQNQKLDFLILNAGGGHFDLFNDSETILDLETIQLNISANTQLLKGLLKILISSSRQEYDSKILFVSSHAALMAVPHFATYSSCKAYLLHLFRILRLELKNEPIELCIALPGAMETQFANRSQIPQMLSQKKNPNEIAIRILQKMGPGKILYFSKLDQIITLCYKFLPLFFTDNLILYAQRILLRRNLKDK